MRHHPKPAQTVAALAVAIAAVGLSACGAVAAVETASLSTYDCAQLAEEAAAISKGEDLELLKVRAPKIVTDNRKTFKKPKDDKEVLVLSCQGTGVWSNGDSKTQVLLSLKVDADGDPFVYYQGQ